MQHATKTAPLFLLLAACGAAPPPDEIADDVGDEPAPRGEFERSAALPAAPRSYIAIDVDAIRGTAPFERMVALMEGDDEVEILGRRVLERASSVQVGLYGEGDDVVVLIARGRLEGVVDATISEVSRGDYPPRIERSGFRAYALEGDAIAAQTAPDTIVLSSPALLSDVLRTAAGAEPSSPLPPEMRALEQRPAFRDAPMLVLFQASARRGEDPLSALVSDAGFAGVAARVEGADIEVTGAALASSGARAAQLAADLERFARETTEEAVGSASLAEGIRGATVRTDARWVELTMRFPAEDFERFLGIVAELGAF
jgi:hypothetical protein